MRIAHSSFCEDSKIVLRNKLLSAFSLSVRFAAHFVDEKYSGANIGDFKARAISGEKYTIGRSINFAVSNLRMKKGKAMRRFPREKAGGDKNCGVLYEVLPFIHLSPGRRRNRRSRATAAVFYCVSDNSAFFPLEFERKVLLSFSIRRAWTILILWLLRLRAPLTMSSMSHKSRSIASNVGPIRNYKSHIPREILFNLYKDTSHSRFRQYKVNYASA